MKESKTMKVIFLDVDGVLNCSSEGPVIHSVYDICFKRLDMLKQIVEQTGAVIVVSSTWRFAKMDRLTEVLESVGMEAFGSTIVSHDDPRHEEIRAWLMENEVEKFAILDDDDDAFIRDKPDANFRTTWEFGLTNEVKDGMIAHLK